MRRRVLCLCVSVKSHLTSGASVHPENTVTYSASNEGQNICGVYSETAPLPRSSTPSVESHSYHRPFFADSAHAYYMHAVAPRVLHFSAFISPFFTLCNIHLFSTGTGKDVVYASIPDLTQIAVTSSRFSTYSGHTSHTSHRVSEGICM